MMQAEVAEPSPCVPDAGDRILPAPRVAAYAGIISGAAWASPGNTGLMWQKTIPGTQAGQS